MTVTVYGIPNCDTVKKARKWLDAQGIDHVFHDFRKDGLDAQKLAYWLAHVDMDILLNRRGTSWRKLSDTDKANNDVAHLTALMLDNPTLVKRPVCEKDGTVTVGFTAQVQDILAG